MFSQSKSRSHSPSQSTSFSSLIEEIVTVFRIEAFTHSPKKVTLRISKSTKTKIITLLFMKAFKHFTHSCCILFSTFPSLSQASLKCLSKIFIPSSPNCWIQLRNNQKIVSLQMSHNYGYKEALPG